MIITNRQALSRDCRAWRKIVMAAKVHNGLWYLRIREQEQEDEEEEQKEKEKKKNLTMVMKKSGL